MRYLLGIILLIAALAVPAEASRQSGRIYGFRTSPCKSSSCYSKHPEGTWVHPLTRRKSR
jgi:hypothetical protein